MKEVFATKYAEKVAELTIAVLKRTVPSAVPGIFFLSGETALDDDNVETRRVGCAVVEALLMKLGKRLDHDERARKKEALHSRKGGHKTGRPLFASTVFAAHHAVRRRPRKGLR